MGYSRLIADVIVSHVFGKEVFSWGRGNLMNGSDARTDYLRAIKAADKGDIKLLLEFARS